MPNWCNNNITIEGPKDKIKKIWDSVQADGDKGFFNHLVPMPKELEGTTSPSSSAKKPQPMEKQGQNLKRSMVFLIGMAGPTTTGEPSGMFMRMTSIRRIPRLN